MRAKLQDAGTLIFSPAVVGPGNETEHICGALKTAANPWSFAQGEVDSIYPHP